MAMTTERGIDYSDCVSNFREYAALYGDDPERSYAATRAFPGNFLFSTGPNNQGGGTRTTRGYYDVPMRDCTVMLDNDVIIDAGRIVDERMVVQAQSR